MPTYGELKDRLRLIRTLCDGWGGDASRAPNATAAWTAECLLDAAGMKSVLPDQLYPCSDGAIAIQWG